MRQTLAIPLILSSLIMGLVGNFIFYGQDLGLSVLIFVSAFILITLLWSVRFSGLPSLRKLWIIIPILFFASMIVIRANNYLLFFNSIAILGLSALFLYYLHHEREIDNSAMHNHIFATISAPIEASGGGFVTLNHGYRRIKERNWNGLNSFMPIVRGLLLTIPIVAIFIVLLSSADAVFNNQVEGFFSIFAIDNLGIIGTRILITLAITWVTLGLFSFALTQRYLPQQIGDPTQEDDTSDSLPKKQTARKFSLGITESGMVLASVVLLFGFFVFIQLTYFFASDVILAEGLSYAEYARRGFFELLAVALLVLGLMLILDFFTIRRHRSEQTIFISLSSIMVLLTFVIMVSAWQRMVLYEQAFGFTYLRVYSHVFIVWLGILLVFGLLHIFRVRANIFALGIILVAIGYLGTLNLMNIDRYIAQQNINRYVEADEELDMCYLRDLSVDALAPMMALYDSIDDETMRNDLTLWLSKHKRLENQRYSTTTIFEFNLAHQTAWEALQDLELLIEEPRTICGYYRNF